MGSGREGHGLGGAASRSIGRRANGSDTGNRVDRMGVVVLVNDEEQLLAWRYPSAFSRSFLDRSELSTEGFLVPVTAVAAKRASLRQLFKSPAMSWADWSWSHCYGCFAERTG
jgi:hypothetical protein